MPAPLSDNPILPAPTLSVLIRSLSYEYPILHYYDPIPVHEFWKKAGISIHLALLNGWHLFLPPTCLTNLTIIAENNKEHR